MSDHQAVQTTWQGLARMIHTLSEAPYWTEKRDCCDQLSRLGRQIVYHLGRASETSDPDVAHWGREGCDRIAEMLRQPLQAVSARMDEELARATAESERSEPTGATEWLAAETPDSLLGWLRRFAESQGATFKPSGGEGASIQLALPGGRHQKIYVDLKHADSRGRRVVLFYSICGQARTETYAWALETNPRLSHGSLGVIRHRDRKVLILMMRSPLAELPLQTLAAKLLYLARKADWAESCLKQTDSH